MLLMQTGDSLTDVVKVLCIVVVYCGCKMN